LVTEKPTQDEFKDTPRDNARRWTMEMKAAREKLSGWHKEAEEAGDALLMRKPTDMPAGGKRLAFFPANVQMLRASMYGRPPRVTSSRRHADANDDVARIASDIQERLLNTDIERDSDTSAEAFGNSLSDSLETDFACVRARYVTDWEDVAAKPAIPPGPDGRGGADEVPAGQRKSREDVEIDYVHWRDVLWGPSRVWSEVPWIAFLVPMSKRQLTEKFGEDVATRVQMNAPRNTKDADARKAHPWARAEVWEIWEKEGKRVFWFVQGFDTVLVPVGVEVDEGGAQPDPLGLDGFWPCPKPIVLNATTSGFVPKPDYSLVKDVYHSIDVLETRCALLTKALKVAGVYDKTLGGKIGSILDAPENSLVPADNWALFAEKGGIRGVIDWLPVEQVANTLNALRDVMREKQDLLWQLTGRNDLERGQATQGGATATEQRAKVRYGSVRMQRRQDEFARFVSDAMRIKAQIISKHFDEATILERCNCEFTADRDRAPEAVRLLKDAAWQFRLEVKPEHLALQDFGALKEESMEVLGGIGAFMQSVGPAVERFGPAALPLFLKLLQVTLARLKGGSAYEALIDQAVVQVEAQQAQQAANPQPPPPDPKVQAQQLKVQGDLAKSDKELQNDLVRLNAEVQADAQREQNQAMWNVREAAAKHALTPPKPAGDFGGKTNGQT
jgi:hypothetical protein